VAPFFLYCESAILIGEGKLHPRIGIDVIIFGLKVLFALCSLCKKGKKGYVVKRVSFLVARMERLAIIIHVRFSGMNLTRHFKTTLGYSHYLAPMCVLRCLNR
jgi:hypothetical protein